MMLVMLLFLDVSHSGAEYRDINTAANALSILLPAAPLINICNWIDYRLIYQNRG